MDITSVLKNEVFRPLTTLVVPGMIAIGPYIILCQKSFQGVQEFASKNSTAYGAIVFIFILFAGLILEDIGGRWENYIADKLEAEDVKNRVYRIHKKIWRDYLKLNTQDQFIGQRYLRTIVTRFYFELAMTPGLIFFIIGFVWLNCRFPFTTPTGVGVVVIVTIGLIRFLYQEANTSASVLSTLRDAIIDGYRGV